MARKYTGNSDGDGKGAKPGTQKLIELCGKRWKFTNLGAYSNRLMRNSNTAGKKLGDPGMEKWLSVHATGRACDVGYTDRKAAVEAWDWFLKYSKELGIEEIHDYAFDSDKADKNVGYGRGYRCSRGEGVKGVKVYDAKDNAGSFGGKWLHFELSPEMANDAAKFEAAWRATPKPGAA